MSWLLRERPDGRRAPGYLLYLLGAALAVGGIFALQRRFADEAGPRPGRPPPASHVAPITQPAATMSRIEVRDHAPRPEGRSYRLDQAPTPTVGPPDRSAAAPAGFDPIAAALADLPAPEAKPGPAGRAPLDEAASGRHRAAAEDFAELPPAFPGDAPPAEARLVGYRDAQADGGRAGAERVAAAERARWTAPRGTLLAVYLLTTVDTSNPAAVLQFGAARALVFHHRRLLPFGTRFLGRLAGAPLRDRLNLTVDTVLYPSGQEAPIRATAVEADENEGNLRPGVAARYFPPPTWVQLAPYLSDVLTGSMGLLAARAQPQLSLGLGGLNLQTSAAAEPRAALYQASGQALQDFTQARLKELGQRYASYYLIPAGTACWLQLETDLDFGPVGPAPASSRQP